MPSGGLWLRVRCGAVGGTNKQAAADLGVDESAVDRWRARFIARRLEGLHDELRPGRRQAALRLAGHHKASRPASTTRLEHLSDQGASVPFCRRG